MVVKKKAKKKKPLVEFTMYDVVLSYPVLDEAREFRGKKYFQVDIIFDEDHAQLKQLNSAINGVAKKAWGEDKSEWPEKIQRPQDGNEREDQAGYKGKRFLSLKTTFRPDVIDIKGREFSGASVKGGMHANVAFNITTWAMPDGDEGLSCFLHSVQVDQTKKYTPFGGGTPTADRYKKGRAEDEEEDEDQDDDDGEDQEDDEDDQPRGKKKKKSAPAEDDDEDDSDDGEDDTDDEDDEDEPPAKKKKKRAPVDEDED